MESGSPKFKDKQTERFAAGERVRSFQSFEQQAKKRLVILESARSLEDLRLLPSNRFESLHGNRNGSFSIRINQQWRICFEWEVTQSKPYNIEFVDYH